jgi:hypothetical protein
MILSPPHGKGIFVTNLDSDLARRYLARLTAVDIAGNRRTAPGHGVPVIWSDSLTVCNDPEKVPAATTVP